MELCCFMTTLGHTQLVTPKISCRNLAGNKLTNSPDLDPSDFHFFLHLKKFLGGQLFDGDDEVKTAVRDPERGRTLLQKLRWATLGYHHNWDTKASQKYSNLRFAKETRLFFVYSEDAHDLFPEDLAELCELVAKAVGFHNFSAQAAIVNYYHLDSTLSGHTDHSEIDKDAPLFSFSESWTLRKDQECRIVASEMKFLRYVAGYTLIDKKRNEDIRKELKMERLIEMINNYRTNWIQHVDRLPETRITKAALQYMPRGRRTLGRPRKRWQDQFFGQSAIFLLGGKSVEEKPIAMLICSGDIVIMSGQSRLCYHGVPRILATDKAPWNDLIIEKQNRSDVCEKVFECADSTLWKPFESYLRTSRINMNIMPRSKCGVKRPPVDLDALKKGVKAVSPLGNKISVREACSGS
ncbi:hypothetical protein ANN_00720 [Periplaneta americana]|uniref:Alpha-ketoglutarate-dependent dioxygenase AlkB-like domain-containing protein n=1 Tax=Periplaneta americana TaxID=6978 RepID=A0ABQ8TRN1_PERAM|nr:hypothetical protein ANN_00720 [Periplaneta americana]